MLATTAADPLIPRDVPDPRPTRRADLVAGARAMAAWLPGIAAYGLVVGVSAARADMPALAGWLTGPTIYGGGAQVAAIDLLDAGAAPVVVVATVLAVNARLVVYSAALAGFWRTTSRRWRLLAAYLLVDPSFAVGVDRYREPGDRVGAHAHYLGGAGLLWITWLAAITVGATAGARLPGGLHLELVVPLFLVGEVVRRLSSPAARRGCAAAVVVAVAGTAAPLHLGPVAAIVAGLAVALTTREDRR
ncbi:MAG TPA: AzlC family ABC transporter permease [Acidimicrobiales bacterium]|nr:AzlC family ABC transporter permease [Acidimicrobiales bacterium]